MSRLVTPHAAFDVILRETIAEVAAAEAIDEADARQSRDEIEQLRLRAAHLITRDEGGPWVTGAPMQFAKDTPPVAPHPTVDIRFPAPVRAVPADEVPSALQGPAGSLPRQGRRIPMNGKRAG